MVAKLARIPATGNGVFGKLKNVLPIERLAAAEH